MSKHKRPVYCKELDKVFPSIQDASLDLNLHAKCIWRCCNGLQKKTDGLTFEYVKKELKELKKGE